MADAAKSKNNEIKGQFRKLKSKLDELNDEETKEGDKKHVIVRLY